MIIRKAKQEDLERITDIYNQAILTNRCTADTETFTVEERQFFFDDHNNDAYPLYVVEEDEVIGYVYLSAYRKRKAMIKTVEVSYYIDQRHLGKGVGTMLLSHAINEAKALGYETLVAILLDINKASIGLLKKFDFAEWGRMPGIAEFETYTCDHIYYGLKLS